MRTSRDAGASVNERSHERWSRSSVARADILVSCRRFHSLRTWVRFDFERLPNQPWGTPVPNTRCLPSGSHFGDSTPSGSSKSLSASPPSAKPQAASPDSTPKGQSPDEALDYLVAEEPRLKGSAATLAKEWEALRGPCFTACDVEQTLSSREWPRKTRQLGIKFIRKPVPAGEAPYRSSGKLPQPSAG